LKTIEYEQIVEAVSKICIDANYYLNDDVLNSFKISLQNEKSEVGKKVLEDLIENAKIAEKEKIALCQDTGVAVFFVEYGQDIVVKNGNLNAAITEGVKKGYKEGYLRNSMCHPFTRKNTGDNTPPIIHTNVVPGEKLKIIAAPKGGGSENMSTLKMITPAQGKQGVMDFVVKTVESAGPNPCPPIVVGIGIGGNFERSAFLAKKSLLRSIAEKNHDPELADLEKEIFDKVNKLGIGPAGFGGNTTALAVHIEMEPCHIASLPVAVNINCHSARHAEIIL
jgi:fumarate hydratase subunit alpha